MADQPPLLTSPMFISRKLSDYPETVVFSPVSVLETKNSSVSSNPFAFHDAGCSKSLRPVSQNQHPNPQREAEAIGLALVYSIAEERISDDGGFSCKPVNRMALLGSKLKIQIPAVNSLSPPSEFGIKTKSSQFNGSFSRSRDLIRRLSLKEMEHYEDYTCVITHGPHPKTTHIFDECIVESSEEDDHTQEKDMKMDFASPHSIKLRDYSKDLLLNSEEKSFASMEYMFPEMIYSGGVKIENP